METMFHTFMLIKKSPIRELDYHLALIGLLYHKATEGFLANTMKKG